MEKILRPVWAEIDLDAIAYNIQNIKRLAGDKEVIAVVKADCYGHGAVDVFQLCLKMVLQDLQLQFLLKE